MPGARRVPYETPDGEPPDEERLRLFMSRHLVTFTGEIQQRRPEVAVFRDVFIYSGFLMNVVGLNLWVTAGHCIEHLEKLLAAPHVELLHSRFGDYHGLDAKFFEGYPMHYQPGMGQLLEDRPAGIDFGFIALDNLAAAAMEKNGVMPVTMSQFLRADEVEFLGFGMLGVPSALTERDAVGYTYYPQMIPLRRVDPSTSPLATSNDWIAFQIAPTFKGLDFKGMSGGPIFGLRDAGNGNLSYNIVAIQSSWDEERGIAFGCSLPHLFKAFERYCDSQV